jgi:hypothetical protein
MGLDIYLYRYDDFEDTSNREEQYSKFEEELWEKAGDYASLSESQKAELNEKEENFAKELGLDKWGSDVTKKHQIEEDHKDYPDHYFKIGYFRSSYNDGGIERILSNLGCPTMHDIFQQNGEEYRFKPDWNESLIRCEDAIKIFKGKGEYRVSKVMENLFSDSEVSSEKEALEIFLEEMAKKRSNDMMSFSNSKGEFHLDKPLEVVAMMSGTTELLGRRKCTYIVTKGDNEWYLQALEIVRDTIKYVLAQDNINQYYLHWSG